jgi:hypothetical protein
VGTRRRPRDLDELHRTVKRYVDAGQLAEPARMPYYVKNPTEPGMGAGWWWKPAGDRPQVLGANVFLAIRAVDAAANGKPDA